MREQDKSNLDETDLVMQQLRAMLEREQNAVGGEENADVQGDRVPKQEQGMAEGSIEGAVAVMVRESEPVQLDTPLAEDPEVGSQADEAKAQGEPTPLPQRAMSKKAGPRKKRYRLPKLTDNEPIAESSFDDALAEKRKRAEALAREDETDLYWRGTSVAKKREKDGAAPLSADPAATTRAVATPNADDTPIEQTAASRRKGIRFAGEKRKEEIASLTVEGLLSDIFGAGARTERAWQDTEKPTSNEESAGSPAPAEASIPQGEEEAPARIPTEQTDGEGATLEFGGTRIILPKEGAPISERTVKNNEPNKAGSDGGESVPLFSAFSVKRQREGALPKPSIARRSAEQMAFKRALEGSDEEFELLVDLDYEDELGEAIGFEKILDYHERHINGKTDVDELRSRGARDRARTREKKRTEYTTHAQDIGICKFYAKQRHRHLRNLAMTAVLFVLLLIYEQSSAVVSLFGATREGMKYSPLYIAVGLMLLLCGAFLLRRHLLGGLLQLVRLAPSDYSFSGVVVLVTVIYHVCLFFAPSSSEMSLCLSPAMGNLCLLATAGMFNWHREFSAFRVISSKQQKYALMSRISVGNREGNARLRLFEQEQQEQRLFVRPVGFVRNYFSNTEKKTDRQSAFGAELLIIAAICCAFALYSLTMGGSINGAWHTAFLTFLFTVPVVSVLGTALPMFCGTCLRLGRRGAIVGEGTVHASGGRKVLVLPDADCFKQMPHEQFELVRGCDVERATVYIRALLEKIESPLVDTVHVPKESRLLPDAITLTEVDEDGVAAVISGERKTPILMGSVSYLQKYGIRVRPKSDGRYEELCRHMICVAINNRLTALFIARYRLHDEMPRLVQLLEEEDLGLKIRSKDPGVHGEMLASLFADADVTPGVIKPLAAERDITADRVDATVVALGSAREVLKTYATCRRIRRAVKLGTLWQFASVLCGAVLSGVLVFFGKITAVPTFVLALNTFLWCGAHAVGSYFMLRDKEDGE